MGKLCQREVELNRGRKKIVHERETHTHMHTHAYKEREKEKLQILKVSKHL